MDWLFAAALIVGSSYWLATELPLPFAVLVVWKGAGVGLLALWAARRVFDPDGRLLAAVLGLGAAGDVLLEVAGLKTGAIAFLVGHILAILLYHRNRRPDASWAWMGCAIPVMALAFALPADRSAASGIALYSAGLALMAAAATMSRFRLAAIGAWLFVASDLLIFAQIGPLAGSFVPDLLVWPLYFTGQALIAWDVAVRQGAGDARFHDRI